MTIYTKLFTPSYFRTFSALFKMCLCYQGRRVPLRFTLAPGFHISRLWRFIATFCAMPPAIPQLLNSSTPQLLNSSTPQLLNSSTPQLLNSSTPQLLNSSTPQLLNSSTPQLLNSSTPQLLNSSTPQLLTSSTPQLALHKKSPVIARCGFAARCEARLCLARSFRKKIWGYAPGAAFGQKLRTQALMRRATGAEYDSQGQAPNNVRRVAPGKRAPDRAWCY